MAAGSTYTPIATYTVSGSTVASIDFTSIPSTYTDLVVVMRGAMSAQSTITGTLNGDTGTNYSQTQLSGDGSSASSGRNSSIPVFAVGIGTTAENNQIIQFQNYSNTTTYKTFLSRSNGAGSYVQARVNLWRSTAAINQITFKTDSGSIYYSSGYTITLYGIASA